MALMAKKSGGSFPLVEAGNHHAICYGVVDLGTQHTEWLGKPKLTHQVLIGWELPDVRIEMEKDGKQTSLPRVISKTYTLILSDKAKLLADLNSWRGKALTEEEKEGFDIFTVIGVNCLLQVIHIEKGGKIYANIASIASLPKGMQKKQPENPIMKYSMEDDGLQLPESLYDWVKDKIKKSAEYQAGESQPESQPDLPPNFNPDNDEPTPNEDGVDMSEVPF